MSNDEHLIIDYPIKGVTRITLNLPEVHNAFDDELIKKLTNVLKKIEKDEEARVVLLAASGKSFSAGANLNWMRRMVNYSEEQNFSDSHQFAELMHTLYKLRQATVALVQGPAYGGGVGLIACCDMAIATPNATFCFSEVLLGIIPAVISPYVMRAIGERHARRYFLTAERFNVDEAMKIGLVTASVDSHALHDAGIALAKKLLRNSPAAVYAAKQLINDVVNHPLDKKLINETARQIAAIRVSAEGQEGLKAFLEKRKPHWTE